MIGRTWNIVILFFLLFVGHTLFFHSMVVRGGWLKKPLQVESYEENKCLVKKNFKTRYLIWPAKGGDKKCPESKFEKDLFLSFTRFCGRYVLALVILMKCKYYAKHNANVFFPDFFVAALLYIFYVILIFGIMFFVTKETNDINILKDQNIIVWVFVLYV